MMAVFQSSLSSATSPEPLCLGPRYLASCVGNRLMASALPELAAAQPPGLQTVLLQWGQESRPSFGKLPSSVCQAGMG